jgi:tyrosinase
MAVRKRKDAWKLPVDDPTFIWYSKAVTEMLKRPIADPTSWRYQAAIHDYDEDSEALRDPEDPLPKKAEQNKYWRQCQHFTWYFLPWHRSFLLYFEEIVAATVVKLGGPAGWSLPYWNYSDESNPNAMKLPPAFIAETLPDGSPNALRVENRLRGNDGKAVGDARHSDLSCLRDPNYTADPRGGGPGYGGPKTRFNHDSGSVVGALESTPHGAMHNRVGDWMASFSLAGLDPIFWVHHANIDRLWAVWRARDPRHTDPTESAWLKMSFPFHDGEGKKVSRTVRAVVDTTALGYDYEDVSDPLGAAFIPAIAVAAAEVEVKKKKKVTPEMVGATETPVPLTNGPTTTRVAMTAPTGPALAAAAAAGPDEAPQRIYLNVENVLGSGAPNTYSVYLNDLFIGVLPLFGVREASRRTEAHAGDGLHYSFDITETAQQLQHINDWDPENLRIKFVPDDEPEQARAAAMAALAPDEPRFQVGRVSLYIA